MHNIAFERQLEEIHIIFCSLLPGESLSFSLAADDARAWQTSLERYPDYTDILLPTTAAQFEVKVSGSSRWFEFILAEDYGLAGHFHFDVSVRGENVTRKEQTHWENLIVQWRAELGSSEYVVYELISTHLLPLLHSDADAKRVSTSEESMLIDSPYVGERYHALLTSHHLISPTKRRNMQLWSSQLENTGFAKVGHPGIIYAEGAKDCVEEFVAKIKAMQWLALRVRSIEPIPEGKRSGHTPRRWTEFEKVGEVVDAMRQIGRESYVVEMGIGAASSK